MNESKIPGTLFIISAPSGAGKTSLVKALLEKTHGISVSVSHTTRKPRPGEKDGKDYFFTDISRFKSLRDKGEFLEHAQVFDNFYGTSKSAVDTLLKQGTDVILEIDWQGAEQVRRQYNDCISIFIVPPSRSELEQRLTTRGQDNDSVIKRRMKDAANEISHYGEFDYLVVNDDFDHSLENLRSIVLARRLHISRQSKLQERLLQDLLGD